MRHRDRPAAPVAPCQSSLLDRFVQASPQASAVDPPLTGLLRDLDWLFAARQTHPLPGDAPGVDFGVLQYGLRLTDTRPETVARALREAMVRFEPRVDAATLRVTPAGPPPAGEAQQALRIIGRWRGDTGNPWTLTALVDDHVVRLEAPVAHSP